MKLWILKPIDPEKGLWNPWYDKAFGFVINADSERDARILASERAGDENPDFRSTHGSPWLDPELTTCEVLEPGDKEDVVMIDFHAA